MATMQPDPLGTFALDYMNDPETPTFTPEARTAVLQFVRGGYDNADSLRDSSQLGRATKSMTVLMRAIGRAAPAGAPISVDVVALTIRNLCPGLWPFC